MIAIGGSLRERFAGVGVRATLCSGIHPTGFD